MILKDWTCTDAHGVVHLVRTEGAQEGPACSFLSGFETRDAVMFNCSENKALTCIECALGRTFEGYLERLHRRIAASMDIPETFLFGKT